MQIIQLETSYLATDVGFVILKNESETLDVVGLKEAVDLCLAEYGGAGENTTSTRLLMNSELLLQVKTRSLTWWAPGVGRQEATDLGASPVGL